MNTGNRIAAGFQIVAAVSLGLVAAVHAYRALFPRHHGQEHHRGR